MGKRNNGSSGSSSTRVSHLEQNYQRLSQKKVRHTLCKLIASSSTDDPLNPNIMLCNTLTNLCATKNVRLFMCVCERAQGKMRPISFDTDCEQNYWILLRFIDYLFYMLTKLLPFCIDNGTNLFTRFVSFSTT